MSIKFTDIRPSFVGSSTYVCPNECLVNLRQVLDKAVPNINKAGSIASGGEVPLTVVLPHVQDHLTIVDHNYGSLFWTATKILLLKHHTNEELVRLFEDSTGNNFFAVVKHLSTENPLTKHYMPAFMPSWSDLRLYWQKEMSPTIWDKARERLDNVELIHGDFRDLSPDIDFLYLSNAMGHSGYKGYQNYAQMAQAVGDMLKAGTIVLATTSHDTDHQIPNCTLVAGQAEAHSHGNHWAAYVVRKVMPQPKMVTERFQYMAQDKKPPTRRVYDYYWGWQNLPVAHNWPKVHHAPRYGRLHAAD